MALDFLIHPLARLITSPRQIGVVGSLGKGSTILAIEIVLANSTKTQAVEINLPMSKLKSDILVVTNAFDLQNEFPTSILVENYANLVVQVPSTGAVILNWDDTECRKLADHTQAEVIFYGTEAKKCHVWAGNIHIAKNRVVFELNYGVERIEVSTNFVSKHQIYSLLAATAVGLREGLRLTQIKSFLEKIHPLSHKLEIISGFEHSTIIDDSFDGIIATTEAALETLNNVSARRRIVGLGQMQQMGKGGEKLLRRIAQKIYKDRLDLVLLGKGEVEIVADELLKLGFTAGKVSSGLANPQIVAELLKVLGRGDWALLKSAKETRFDEVVAKISKK